MLVNILVKDMVLTEFDEEVFVDGIREEGREEGKNDLINAIRMIREGKDKNEIIAQRIDAKTVELAENI